MIIKLILFYLSFSITLEVVFALLIQFLLLILLINFLFLGSGMAGGGAAETWRRTPSFPRGANENY